MAVCRCVVIIHDLLQTGLRVEPEAADISVLSVEDFGTCLHMPGPFVERPEVLSSDCVDTVSCSFGRQLHRVPRGVVT
jgi:hypothetical protein